MDTIIERVIFLQGVELFSDIPSEQLGHLAGITQRFTAEAGETLFKEGDPSDSMFVLIDGKVQLFRNEVFRLEVTEPQALGVWGFFDEGSRLTTIRCPEESHFLKINRMDFFDLLEERVHISEGLLKYFVHRIRALIEQSDIVV